MKYLVIVESPTKSKTIGKFLGDDYVIKFSMGHVMDLPKSKLGVDIVHNFKPQLEVVNEKKQIIAELKDAAKSVEMIILATDPDREGEAIASNIKDILSSNLKVKNKNVKFERIVFHEITKEAVTEALTHPREVDQHLVDAQIARRVLDRLVGYQISPVLWQKVRRGLSAGRVQSVALRLLVEREREIEAFNKEPYYTVHTFLRKDKEKHGVEFELIEKDGKKLQIQQTSHLYDGDYTVSKTTIVDQQTADEIVVALQKAAFTVSDVVQKESRRSPQPPYTTSTLQQDASRRFGYPGKRTMSVAQKLYEEGYITYHRTDSVILSTASVTMMRSYIKETYGSTYIPSSARIYATKQKLAQEAHEGIRPTQIQRLASEVIATMGADCGKLYELIWRRAISSQMADAIIESTSVIVDTVGGPVRSSLPASARSSEPLLNELRAVGSPGISATPSEKPTYRLKTNGSVLKFDGFLKVNPQALSDTRLPSYV
jgi:DNA topoisomerase-1